MIETSSVGRYLGNWRLMIWRYFVLTTNYALDTLFVDIFLNLAFYELSWECSVESENAHRRGKDHCRYCWSPDELDWKICCNLYVLKLLNPNQ